MNLLRFFSLGFDDADRRVRAALTPGPVAAIDHYLDDSVVVKTIDRATMRLSDWWRASLLYAESHSLLVAQSRTWTARNQAVATMIAIAVVTHVGLTLLQGPRPGWFWMLIPAMALTFALLLIVGSRR